MTTDLNLDVNNAIYESFEKKAAHVSHSGRKKIHDNQRAPERDNTLRCQSTELLG